MLVPALSSNTLWGKKNSAPLYFCNNFVKTSYSETIIGTSIHSNKYGAK